MRFGGFVALGSLAKGRGNFLVCVCVCVCFENVEECKNMEILIWTKRFGGEEKKLV